MIRGFSELSGINCLDCHYKCCASEYRLPLTKREEEYIIQKYPSFFLFLDRGKNKQFLLRGDRCPFLKDTGLCLLHQTEYKPLVCQTYPLIFWKYDPEELLVWINPCRGNGFQWVIEEGLRISSKQIEDLVIKIDNKFDVYWGEDIDLNNPYRGITKERIDQERTINLSNTEHSLLNHFIQLNFPKEYLDLISQLQKNNECERYSSLTNNLDQVISAVLKWLCWSPVGLNLSFRNSKLIFTVAALWVRNTVISFLDSDLNQPISLVNYLNNIGFFLAQSILPEFWAQLTNKIREKKLRRFSLKVKKVLKGEISQQSLISEYL